MSDKQERMICELITRLASDGFDQNEIEKIIKTMRTWTFLKYADDINDALCRGVVMVAHVNTFRNAMMIKD